jgi:hypothetical protein
MHVDVARSFGVCQADSLLQGSKAGSQAGRQCCAAAWLSLLLLLLLNNDGGQHVSYRTAEDQAQAAFSAQT